MARLNAESLPHLALGALLGVAAMAIPLACGSGAQLSPRIRCQLQALEGLPANAGEINVYHALDALDRLRACGRVKPPPGDAGAP